MIDVNMRRRQLEVGGSVSQNALTGGDRYPICLLRAPQNKSSGRFDKPGT